MGDSLSLVKGTLDALVLKALSWTPMHGFEITCWLEEHSSGALELNDSALYQALYRMEERGLVKAEWGVTENNRRARYYSRDPPGAGVPGGGDDALPALRRDGDGDPHRRDRGLGGGDDPTGDPAALPAAAAGGGAREAELEEEIRLHLELRAERLEAGGSRRRRRGRRRGVASGRRGRPSGRCGRRRGGGRGGCGGGRGRRGWGRTRASPRGCCAGARASRSWRC